WEAISTARPWSISSRAHPLWSAGPWPHMTASPWEAADDSHRSFANHADRSESDRHRCPSGSFARSRFEERAVLCRLPARSDERGSRRAKTTVPEDAAATGAPSIHEDVRPVRYWFSALDR